MSFLSIFETFPKVRKYFGIDGVFVKELVIFHIGFGLCVFNSIWEHRLKIFFDPKNRENRPRKIEKIPEA